MSVKRQAVESTVEDQIVLAMILSTDFNNKIDPIINLDFFLSPYAKIVVKWCRDYFRQYKKAPILNIKAIYDLEKDSIDKAVSDIIGVFLSKLNDDYVNGEINYDYVYDKAMDYFDSRDLDLRLDRAVKLKAAGRTKEARDVITEKSKLERAVAKWEDVFTVKAIKETYLEKERKGIVRFPGMLGEMIGDLERGWLFGILGGFKRGKSYYMMDLGVNSLCNRLNVAFISLEMDATEVRDRFYRRISGVGDGEEQYMFPVFDCVLNQIGECDSPNRTNNVRIRQSKSEIIKFREFDGYNPCSYCREVDPRSYKPDIWYEPIKVPDFSIKAVQKEVMGFRGMYGNRLKIKCYPRFSASVEDIMRDLNVLEYLEGFIPDVIIIDYASILKPERGSSKEKRDIIDDTWKTLARLASERHALVVTGHQGNRGSLKKHLMEEEDIAEWIGILAHVNVFSALSQTPIEKERGMIRFNLLAHRHKKFLPDLTAIVLQHLDTGQTHVDSEIGR